MNSQNIDVLIAQLHELSSDKPDNQFKAAIALGDITDMNSRNRIVNELIKALSLEHQALTRAHAAEALGKLGDPMAALPLIDALNDDYQLVRSYSARALGKLNDPIAVKAIYPLIEILGEDKFFGARAEAAEALGKLCKLCRDDDTKAKIAKSAAEVALDSYRKKEEERMDKKEDEGRSRRVLAEMILSLKRLNVLANDTLEAIKQGKKDFALSLAKEIVDEVNRMGAYTR